MAEADPKTGPKTGPGVLQTIFSLFTLATVKSFYTPGVFEEPIKGKGWSTSFSLKVHDAAEKFLEWLWTEKRIPFGKQDGMIKKTYKEYIEQGGIPFPEDEPCGEFDPVVFEEKRLKYKKRDQHLLLVWFQALPGSGKSFLANKFAEFLKNKKKVVACVVEQDQFGGNSAACRSYSRRFEEYDTAVGVIINSRCNTNEEQRKNFLVENPQITQTALSFLGHEQSLIAVCLASIFERTDKASCEQGLLNLGGKLLKTEKVVEILEELMKKKSPLGNSVPIETFLPTKDTTPLPEEDIISFVQGKSTAILATRFFPEKICEEMWRAILNPKNHFELSESEYNLWSYAGIFFDSDDLEKIVEKYVTGSSSTKVEKPHVTTAYTGRDYDKCLHNKEVLKTAGNKVPVTITALVVHDETKSCAFKTKHTLPDGKVFHGHITMLCGGKTTPKFAGEYTSESYKGKVVTHELDFVVVGEVRIVF